MALTRKFLSALGIEEEKAEQIIQAHVDTVDPIKAERDKYKEDAEKLSNVQKELNELKAKTSGEDPFKDKYNELKKEYDAFKADTEAKELTAKKEAEYKKILKDIGIPEKRLELILKATRENLNNIELDDEGKVKDGNKLKDALKTELSEFISTTVTEGVTSANPPATSTPAVKTKKEIMEIKDTAERQKAWKDFISANSNNGGN